MPSQAANLRGIVLRLPIETWNSIFSSLCQQTEEEDATRDLLSLSRTCSAFQFEAEPIIYRHVRLMDGPAQLLTFASAVARYAHRAEAVRSLYLWHPEDDPDRIDEEVIKDILQRLPNLKSLHVGDCLEDPYGVLIHSPFRLHSFEMDGDAFVCLHSEERCRMSRIQGCSEKDITSVRCEFLSELTTLTLMEISPSLPDALLKYSMPYNITHLNIVFSFECEDRSSLHPFAEQLVSLRVYPAPRPRATLSTRFPIMASHPWPTMLVMDHVFPRLKYLELDEDKYYQLRTDFSVQAPFLTERWRSSCPAIQTFVWRPALVYYPFARQSEWYRGAVRDFTEQLFREWTTLQRFERTRLKLTGIADEEAYYSYVAYTRTEDGSVITVPAEYDEDLWHRV
ncbi:hypothetical protein L226DRAFT_613891 [Lentinus tigrinus ALCF2SS1-7]|uniref:uncharacterized protein n=1 Tax=Lentinus tigrinus ALCF2SS1-7 TaxID=1328758 RepID=UPI00116638AD|nr:hypothetical protein L226DRAFT_613891 [Lentinus tigrinus ALCF2SS1-7]